MKWLFIVKYRDRGRRHGKQTVSGLVSILTFLLDLPYSAWRDIESVQIMRVSEWRRS